MLNSDVPTKFPIPFGNAAGGAYIRTVPQASQVGVQNGAASLTDGFPPNCFVPIAGGGSWPFGQDFNGLLKQVTQWLRWQAAGGPLYYDSSYSAAIGGYPRGATLLSTVTPALVWVSTADNNTSIPDSGGANWTSIYGQAHIWTALQTLNAGALLPNNISLSGKDTSGVNHAMIGYLSDNYVHIVGGQNGVVINDVAGTANNVIVSNAGAVTVRDFLFANRLRATVGAYNSGDANRGVILNDFTRSYSGVDVGYMRLPDGSIDQITVAGVPCGGGIQTTLVTLPVTFPGNILDAIICFYGTTPPGSGNAGSIAVQAQSPSQVAVTTNYAATATLGVVIRARGY